MSGLLLIIILVYVILMVALFTGSVILKSSAIKHREARTTFTIIIPFRNEEENLPALLDSIAALIYTRDLYEIILVDDASSDASKHIVLDFMHHHPNLNISCVASERKTGSPKKDAITLGIQRAQYDWIVMTDADCRVPVSWLHSLNNCILEKECKMIAGPVAIATTTFTFFRSGFEQLDMLSLMGVTMGGFGLQLPFMCNGAHLAYEKKAFADVGGFIGNDDLATGDDHFLLEKFYAAFPKQVVYLKSPEAIVTTQGQVSWQALLLQRVRWASKAKRYAFWFAKLVGLTVFLSNLAIIVSQILVVMRYGVSDQFSGTSVLFAKAESLQFLFISIGLKLVVDFLIIAKTAAFYNRKQYLLWYPIVAVCYPFITVWIAVRSLVASYEWKGRVFTK